MFACQHDELRTLNRQYEISMQDTTFRIAYKCKHMNVFIYIYVRGVHMCVCMCVCVHVCVICLCLQ